MTKVTPLLSLAFALTACGGAKSSEPKGGGATSSDGKIQAFKIGAFDAWSLQDGTIEAPNDGKILGVGQAPEEINKVLAANGLPTDTLALGIQVLLVKAGTKVDLFDTGAGTASFAKAGHIQASLAKAGMKAADVTDIFISHSHSDHTNGLVTKGALAFPNATIHMSKAEWEFMQNVEAGEDPEAKAVIAVITPKVVAFDPGAQVAPEVLAIDTHGHTPGHTSYEIVSGEEKLIYLGDLAHHSVINVQKPDWSDAYDTDHDAANTMRFASLKILANANMHVFGVHFPFPGLGHIVQDGDHQVFKPDAF